MINQYSSNYPSKNRSVFDSFVAFDSNQEAKSLALQFAYETNGEDVLGITCNNIGNGATHLALCILNEIEKANMEQEIFYTGFERLEMNDNSINELTIFDKDWLNSKSLILIDSFYHTSNQEFKNRFFNVLSEVKTKIIFTYGEGIKVPLVTKEIRLSTPSKIDKELILKNVLTSGKINLENDIVDFLINQEHLSVRVLESLIISVQAQKTLGKKSDVESLRNFMTMNYSFN
jgi:chromosomal replication initiation ATPase DnaA